MYPSLKKIELFVRGKEMVENVGNVNTHIIYNLDFPYFTASSLSKK
jgi:hypothetical protein